MTIDIRVREMLSKMESRQGHGFWSKLAELSDISKSSWSNMYAKRQNPTLGMIEILAKLHPEWVFWMITGITDKANGHTAPPEVLTFLERGGDANCLIEAKNIPDISKLNEPIENTVEERVILLFKLDMALLKSPHGYWSSLEIKTGIPSKRWRKVNAREQRITSDMLQAIANVHPKYSFWLLTGLTEDTYAGSHVKPSNKLLRQELLSMLAELGEYE